MAVPYYPMAVQPLSPELLAKLRSAPADLSSRGSNGNHTADRLPILSLSRTLKRRALGQPSRTGNPGSGEELFLMQRHADG